MTIEGIPDGWELVRIGQAMLGDHWLGSDGRIGKWEFDTPSTLRNYIIIRKIEKPKQFRAFENAAEAEPFFDRRLRYKSCSNAILRITVLGRNGIEIAGDKHTYQQAFDRFECTDGTPFGLEV